jgi:hypothetical protein
MIVDSEEIRSLNNFAIEHSLDYEQDKISPYLTAANETLESAHIPMILWGENAMRLHGIPTALLIS